MSIYTCIFHSCCLKILSFSLVFPKGFFFYFNLSFKSTSFCHIFFNTAFLSFHCVPIQDTILQFFIGCLLFLCDLFLPRKYSQHLDSFSTFSYLYNFEIYKTKASLQIVYPAMKRKLSSCFRIFLWLIHPILVLESLCNFWYFTIFMSPVWAKYV